MILREIGQYHRARGRADLAHEALERAADLFKVNGDRLDEAWCRLDVARMLRDLGDLETSRRGLTDCVRLFANTGDLGGEAETLLDLARMDAKSAPKAAERMLRQSADLARRAGLGDLSIKAEQEAADMAAA
jgi:tetratricopeptide (TPR) repeat protein